MINIKCVKPFCKDDISLIKNYDKAINDNTKTWDCHHINELTYTKNELIKMNMYYNRPACELIFLTRSEHNKIHLTICAGAKERKQKQGETSKKTQRNKNIKSDFGKKYFEHYGYSESNNVKQYFREREWYKRHKKCRWED